MGLASKVHLSVNDCASESHKKWYEILFYCPSMGSLWCFGAAAVGERTYEPRDLYLHHLFQSMV